MLPSLVIAFGKFKSRRSEGECYALPPSQMLASLIGVPDPVSAAIPNTDFSVHNP